MRGELCAETGADLEDRLDGVKGPGRMRGVEDDAAALGFIPARCCEDFLDGRVRGTGRSCRLALDMEEE